VEVVVLISCWSAKGGSGTTVVAASLAILLSRGDPAGAVLADLAGDAPAVLGLPEPDSPGLAGWLDAGPAVPADALARLEVTVAPGLTLLPRGRGELGVERADVLANLLDQGNRPVVADCGTHLHGAAEVVAAGAGRSLLVTRPCYLSLRHALRATQRPSGVLVIREPGRALGRDDIERVVGAPVLAEIEADPAVARAVDAGLLSAARLPRSIEKALRHAA
jgi:MinD-like ATPase involved in chromosome partitioning or flagellar assembly